MLVLRHKASHTSRFLCGVKRLPIASLDGPSRAPWGTIGRYEAGDSRLIYSVIGDIYASCSIRGQQCSLKPAIHTRRQ